MDTSLQDVRFAFRTLSKAPAFTAVAILTLALGIGASTAIFSIVNGVILKPLPYPAPERLVQIWEHNDNFGPLASSWTSFLDWRRDSRSVGSMAAYRADIGTVLGGEEPLRARTTPVSEGFFRVLDVAPAIGTGLGPDDHRLGADPAAVVSDSFWRNELAAAPLESLRLVVAGFDTRVVGVMPPGFAFPVGTDVWFPIELSEQSASRTAHNWRVVGRLAAGVDEVAAQEEITMITERFPPEDPPEFMPQRARVVSLRQEIAGPVRRPLLLLMGASVLVVLVACTNLASALLARGGARGGELAVLRALGAERGRVVRRLFTESLVLAIAGAAVGLALAWGLIRWLPGILPSNLPRIEEIGLHWTVAAFTVVVSMGSALLFGLLPAWRISDTQLAAALRSEARGSSGARSRGPWRFLVAGEVALALVLLTGAGLLMRSFWSILQVEMGFEPRAVLTMTVNLPASEYAEFPRRAAYFDELLAEVRALPGVADAGMGASAPLSGIFSNGLIRIDGGPEPSVTAAYQVAEEGYFKTLAIPVLRGRLFQAGDTAASSHVAVVNRALAELAWPGEDPVGKRLTGGGMDSYWDKQDAWATVVGVVGDVRPRDLTRDAYPTFYFSYRQRPDRVRGGVIVLRAATGDPNDLVGALRGVVREIDPDVPVQFATMDERVADALGDRRFTMGVLVAFAGLALLLAALGIYGVVAYTVSLRTREMGIRMALGASPSGVLALVFREAMLTVVAGLVVGLAAVLASGRVLASLLFDVSPSDPLALGVTALTLLAAAGLASFLPARRAASIDPLASMRVD